MKAKVITKEIMDYFYEKDGWLYWKKIYSNKCTKYNIDDLAGCLHKSSGYFRIMINGIRYFNHRILYQFYNNVILNLNQEIDHIDGNTQNNSKENLRLCTNSQNQMNRKARKNNKSTGIKCLYIDKQGYRIIIGKNKQKFSKRFPITTPIEQVIEIRDRLLKELHGDFHNLG